jgi:hypothetical protein
MSIYSTRGRALLRASCAFLLLFLSLKSAHAQTTVSGDVSGVWTKAGSPYLVEGSVTIPAGEVLVVQPGVEVRTASVTWIYVYGTLTAKGLVNDSIRFVGVHPQEPNAHGGTLVFTTASVGSVLDYVSIHRWGNSYYGTGAVEAHTASLTITNSRFRQHEAAGVYITAGTPSIHDNRFSPGLVAVSAGPGNLTNTIGNKNAAIKLRNEMVTGHAVLPFQSPTSHYFLDGGFYVDQGATLEISAGVEIRSLNF